MIRPLTLAFVRNVRESVPDNALFAGRKQLAPPYVRESVPDSARSAGRNGFGARLAGRKGPRFPWVLPRGIRVT